MVSSSSSSSLFGIFMYLSAAVYCCPPTALYTHTQCTSEKKRLRLHFSSYRMTMDYGENWAEPSRAEPSRRFQNLFYTWKRSRGEGRGKGSIKSVERSSLARTILAAAKKIQSTIGKVYLMVRVLPAKGSKMFFFIIIIISLEAEQQQGQINKLNWFFVSARGVRGRAVWAVEWILCSFPSFPFLIRPARQWRWERACRVTQSAEEKGRRMDCCRSVGARERGRYIFSLLPGFL